MDEIREEVAKWSPAEVERVTGVAEADVYKTAKLLSENRPGCVVWCMGGTQHTTGNNNTRAYCVLELALGNMGKSGGGANIFRGHDNVQGGQQTLAFFLILFLVTTAFQMVHGNTGLKSGTLSTTGFRNVFDQSEYRGKKKPMNNMGIPVSRWIDGVLENKDNMEQNDNIRAMFYWGARSQLTNSWGGNA
ncbi:molybdopterin-dependent oxidoreductase [Vibrio sinaloensis]|nr:molybdopterin-dependent oxidoreductase [Vibrio sinaloensis]